MLIRWKSRKFDIFLDYFSRFPSLSLTSRPVRHNGRGTVYTQDGATGSCGHANGDNTLIAAIGNYWMKHQSPSPYCGRRIQAKNTGSNDGVGGKGNTITVIVQDTCYSCGENDIDFSVAAWNKLTNGAPFGNFDAQWYVPA